MRFLYFLKYSANLFIFALLLFLVITQSLKLYVNDKNNMLEYLCQEIFYLAPVYTKHAKINVVVDMEITSVQKRALGAETFLLINLTKETF